MDVNEKLCLSLARADTEEGVIDILKKSGYWDRPEHWVNYGRRENNFSIIGNQQAKPDSALVEKIINSVDHMLIKECILHGIKPEDVSAPQSMTEAVEDFFRIKGGLLFRMQPEERGKLAENICLVATGSKSNPCYSIIDKGEGQTPKKMPETFLSLGESNKLRIPFVQGKFNQGGTGVLQFCGDNNLQLIVTRRHPEIAKKEPQDETRDKWGFTIVRRESPKSGGIRNSVYKYLAPFGNVLNFNAGSLPLLPGEYPESTSAPLEYGSFIKLYEYEMTGYKTNILFDLYNRLSLLLPNIALPCRLYERRKGYTGHTFETTLSGLSVRLEEDRRENIEPGFPASGAITVIGQNMNCLIYAFKEGGSEKYVKSEGILFIQNGQTQGHIKNAFFSRKSVKMNYLSDSILVLIDCSKFDTKVREDLFLASRDRLREGKFYASMEEKLEDFIAQNQGLKELRERRRREELESKLEDSKPLADLLEDIIKKSPSLVSLFIEGTRVTNPFKLRKVILKSKEYRGKNYPDYFKLVGLKNNEKPCPINRRFRVQYETNASNDYFEREENPGYMELHVNGKVVQDKILNLWNGFATLTVTLSDGVSVGERLKYKSVVKDVTNDAEPFISDFDVIVEDAAKKTDGGKGKRKEPPVDETGNEGEIPTGLSLPQIKEVHQDEWEKHDFDQHSALKVKDTGEGGYDFFINVDNIYLLGEMKSQTKIEPDILKERYKCALVLIGLALLKDENCSGKDRSQTESEDIYTKIGKVSKAISPIILPMISYLGTLELESGQSEN